MKCPRCDNESAVMFSDGCPKCHETNEADRFSKIRASIARVDNSTPAPSPVVPVIKKRAMRRRVVPSLPVVPAPTNKKKEEPPMSKTQQIRWTPDECKRVATEVGRLFPGLSFAAKAVKQAQESLPADRRKDSIGPNDIKKIRALIPGSEAPRPGASRGRGKALAKVSRRATASAAPALLQPVPSALPTSESLADSIAQQLVSAVVGVGVQALEKAAGRLRSITA